MRRRSSAAVGAVLSWTLLASPFVARAGSAAEGFADPALAGELQQLGSRLARSLPQDSQPLFLITSIDEEVRLAGGDRCLVVHVTAARRGAAVATAQAIACPIQAGWTLRDETLHQHR